MNFHETVNAGEAILWAVIGSGFVWQAIQSRKSKTRTRCSIAAAAFFVFGLSDVIEITTGAWWRPWWLLLMKAVCVVALIGLYAQYRRDARNDSSNENL